VGAGSGRSCSRRGPAAASSRGLRRAAQPEILSPVKPPPLLAARGPRRLAQARAGQRRPRSRQDLAGILALPGRARGHCGALLLLVAAVLPSASEIERFSVIAHGWAVVVDTRGVG